MCFEYVHIRPCGHKEFLAFQPCDHAGNGNTTHIEIYDLPVPPDAPCPTCAHLITMVDGRDTWNLTEEIGAQLDQQQTDRVRHDRHASYNAYVEAQRRAGLWWNPPTHHEYRAHVIQNHVLRRSHQALDLPQQFQGLGHYPYGGWQEDRGTGTFRFAPDVRTHVQGQIPSRSSEPRRHGCPSVEMVPTINTNPSGFDTIQASETLNGSGHRRVGKQDHRRTLDPNATQFIPPWGQPDSQ